MGMNTGSEEDDEREQLRQALRRLESLRRDLRESNRRARQGNASSPDQLTEHLERIEYWLEDLVALLRDRRNPDRRNTGGGDPNHT